MRKSIYVSSTYEDLKEHRRAVCEALSQIRFPTIGMENYVARDARMTEECLRDVDRCDIYLGIFAWRYGHVPPRGNPDQVSITELEYLQAKGKKPCLIFVLEEGAVWDDKFRDSLTGENGRGTRIQKLRESLNSNHMPGRFSTIPDLAQKVVPSIYLEADDAKIRAISGDLSSASCLTMQSSILPEIVTNIKRAITENVKTDIIKVNLGEGKSWWSTRLHLLAALCAEYTEVRQLLFEAKGFRFLGMCAPSQARRVLSRSFPEVEAAYRKSLLPPNEVHFNPVDDVDEIVKRFSSEMDNLGGEPTVKRWVEPHLIEDWPRVNRASVDLCGLGATPELLEILVQRDDSFVVLVEKDIVQKVINRAALATRMALGGP